MTKPKLVPQRKNANQHTQRGLGMLEKSIQRDGWISAITAAANGEIFDGSARVNVMAEKFVDEDGKEVEPIVIESDGTRPVVFVRKDIPTADDPRARRLSIAANQITAVDWSPDGALLAEWAGEDEQIKALFQDSEWQEITGEKPEPKDAPVDMDRAAELQAKWGTELGQLWRLGEHRLLIGDCTVRENVERVMGGERAGACVTDSPYGINREGIENDDPEGLRKLFDGVLAYMPIENGVVINFQSPRLFPVWLDALRSAGHKFERALWMHKINDVTNAWRQWMMNGEIIIISTIGKAEWGNPTPPTQDCYTVTHDTKIKIAHTSVKPLSVIDDVIRHTVGDVFDPFAGSGTTGMAAQNLGRRAHMMEISEKYAAVILQRFFDSFPGLPIERIEP